MEVVIKGFSSRHRKAQSAAFASKVPKIADVIINDELDNISSSNADKAYPSGGTPRPPRAGGHRAAKAVMFLHKERYHASAPVMERPLLIAGIREAVKAARDTLVNSCKVCRTWERPQIKPMARTELCLEINKRFLGMRYITLLKMQKKYSHLT